MICSMRQYRQSAVDVIWAVPLFEAVDCRHHFCMTILQSCLDVIPLVRRNGADRFPDLSPVNLLNVVTAHVIIQDVEIETQMFDLGSNGGGVRYRFFRSFLGCHRLESCEQRGAFVEIDSLNV